MKRLLGVVVCRVLRRHRPVERVRYLPGQAVSVTRCGRCDIRIGTSMARGKFPTPASALRRVA